MTTGTVLLSRELLPAGLSGPHNPTWHELRRHTAAGWSITASEIAAVMGISPWHSPFSLYWSKMCGWITDDNPYMRWGRKLEAVVGEDFADTHPDLEIMAVGLLAHPMRAWQMATPDLLARRNHAIAVDGVPIYDIVPVQLKTERTLDDRWGPAGTDIIPVHYRAQVQWEIDVVGSVEGVLYVLPLDTREPRAYVIRRDEGDLRIMREYAQRFRARLDAGETPELDNHVATLDAIKRLHPALVDDAEVEVPHPLADGYRRAYDAHKRADALLRLYETRMREAMGTAKYATDNGARIASRSMYPHHLSGTIVDKLVPTKSKRRTT